MRSAERAIALCLLGCAGAPPETAGAPPPPVAPPSAMAVAGPSAVPIAADTAPPAPAAATPARWADAPFPPPAFAPMHERTAKPGDGSWTPMPEGAHAGGHFMYRAEVHPQPIKPHPFVTLIAFDRRHLRLALAAGTEEPASKSAPDDQRTGLVPRAHQPQLVAIFNGGFKTEHGRYGAMIDGVTYVPPKEDACAVALFDDDIAIRSWPELAERAAGARAWRQTPPCLVERGAINPRLEGELRSRKWGAAQGGDREIRRSAVALDESGRTLIYAFGDWVSAGDLARALHAAGAHDAAQLDINWSYTRFYTVSHEGGSARLSGSIIPKASLNPINYLEKPSFRDFFYVMRRQ